MSRSLVIVLILVALSIVITLITFVFWPSKNKTEAPVVDTSTVITPETSIVVSRDGGATWQHVFGSQNLVPSLFEFQKESNAQFYVGTRGNGLWIYNPNKKAIEQVKDATGVLASNADILGFAEDSGGKTLYLGTFVEDYGRVIKLTQEKTEEIYKTPLPKYGIFGVAVSPENSDMVHAAVGDGSFLESTDAGRSKSWEVISRIGKEGITLLRTHPDEPGMYWALGSKGSLFVTETGGRLWRQLLPPKVDKIQIKAIYDIEYNSARDSLFLATNYGLLESKDNGLSWIAFKTPLPPATIPITAAIGHPRFEEVFWMAAANQVYRTDDGGVSWKRIDIPTEKRIIFLRVDPTNPRIVYAGLSK